MYNILALDQSSQTSGFAIFRDGQLFQHGAFTISDKDIGIRLHKIRKKIKELIDDFDIDEVALEDIYVDNEKVRNIATFKVLAQVLGVCMELCEEENLPYTVVAAKTWKSTCGIAGTKRPEQKRNTQKYVLDTYGVKATQDACDAIGIGTHIVKKPKAKQSELNWD